MTQRFLPAREGMWSFNSTSRVLNYLLIDSRRRFSLLILDRASEGDWQPFSSSYRSASTCSHHHASQKGARVVVLIQCIQCHRVDITLDAPNQNNVRCSLWWAQHITSSRCRLASQNFNKGRKFESPWPWPRWNCQGNPALKFMFQSESWSFQFPSL